MGDAAGDGEDRQRSKNVNLFFGTKTELADVAKREDASTSYIILQNDRLHSQADRLQRRIRDLERERDRASDDSDRAERSRTCLRGMLHNEVEKSEILGDMVAQLSRDLSGHKAASARLCGNAMVHAAVSMLVHAVGCWVSGSDHLVGRLMLSVHVGNAAVFGWLCSRPPAPSADGRVSELRDKLADAERGTAHLHGIIDEL